MNEANETEATPETTPPRLTAEEKAAKLALLAHIAAKYADPKDRGMALKRHCYETRGYRVVRHGTHPNGEPMYGFGCDVQAISPPSL